MAKSKKPTFDSEDVFLGGHMDLIHSQALAAARGRSKSIAAEEIARRLTVAFGRPIDSPADPIGKYIHGGAAALRAFPIALNRTKLFAVDEIIFTTGEFDTCTTVGQLGGIIVKRYVQAGWDVT